MNAIIFSKDRAMQLDCLLRSMDEFMPFVDPVILWDYSDNIYRDAYWQVMQDHDAEWLVQQTFKVDFETLILPGWNCLLVDDDIFYRQVDEYMLIQMMEEVDIVSLRLGDDIKGHRDYKGSVDGNFFKFDTLMKLQSKDYHNPNKLESRLTNICKDMTMGWFTASHLKGIPANRVSDTSHCDHMDISTRALNEMYLEGKRIDYRKINLQSKHPHKHVNIMEYCL